MEKIKSSASGTHHILPQHNIMVVTALDNPLKDPTSPVKKETTTGTPGNVAKWGDSNNYPQEIYKKARANSIIPATIEWKARTVRSGGVSYGVMEFDQETGTEKFKRVQNAEVDEFMEYNDLDSYFEESLSDLYWWGHIFPELGLRKDRKKIVSLVHQESMFARFEKQDPKSGEIKHVLLNANWPEYKKEFITRIPTIDRYWNPVGQIMKGSAHKYIFPLSYASPGRVYYQEPPWHSIFHGKWLDVANQIPEFKTYLMTNQMSIKYMVHIPQEWWEWKYPGFNTQGKYTDKKRKEIMKTELDRFNDLLTGVESTGKTLMMTYKTDAHGKDFTKWEIQQFAHKKESGEYIEESQEASSHILFALGVDGTLIGNSPGKQMGAGSGSDKRVAFNIFIMNNKPYQDKVLKPLELIGKYNGWKHDGKPIKWRFNNYLIAKLDEGKETKKD